MYDSNGAIENPRRDSFGRRDYRTVNNFQHAILVFTRKKVKEQREAREREASNLEKEASFEDRGSIDE